MQPLDFQRLFEALPSPHMLLDRDLRYVAVNAAYEAVTMRKRAELVGQNLFDLFPNEGDSGRRLRSSLERVFDTGESDTLAYIPYDIPRPEALGGGMEQRYWTAVHVPVRDDSGAVAFVMQNTVDVTDFARLREAATLPFRSRPGETALIERAREVEEAHRTLLADSADFRRLFKQAPSFIAVLSGPTHVFTFVNDAYRKLIGSREVVGLSISEALPEVEEQGFVELLNAVYRDGTQRGGEGVRVMLQQSPDEQPVETFLDFSYAAIRNGVGEINGIFVQGMDRTDSFRDQRRQKLLLDELNHRVKNTLATVQSIAAQTFRSTADPSQARASFERRLVALSRTHDLLSERQWVDAELRTIVDQELAAFDNGRRVVHGPLVVLNAKSSIALAMVLHELASNAARRGALSTPGGSVSVTWAVLPDRGDERLALSWKEQGGPANGVEADSFGLRVIDRAVRGELGGSAAFNQAGDSVTCEMTIPLRVLTETANEFV